MVVEDVEQHIGLLLFQPGADGLEAFEDRCPGGFMLLVVIDGETDGRGVGYGETTNDASHDCYLLFCTGENSGGLRTGC
ncbi:hypothetical protein D3C78_1708320 [compost metagenome]